MVAEQFYGVMFSVAAGSRYVIISPRGAYGN